MDWRRWIWSSSEGGGGEVLCLVALMEEEAPDGSVECVQSVGGRGTLPRTLVRFGNDGIKGGGAGKRAARGVLDNWLWLAGAKRKSA